MDSFTFSVCFTSKSKSSSDCFFLFSSNLIDFSRAGPIYSFPSLSWISNASRSGLYHPVSIRHCLCTRHDPPSSPPPTGRIHVLQCRIDPFQKERKKKNRRSLIETEIISFDFHSLFLCRAYTNPIVRKGNTSSLFFFKSFHSSHVALRVLPSNHKMLLRFRPFHLHVRRRIFDLVRWKSGGENISFRLNGTARNVVRTDVSAKTNFIFFSFSHSTTAIKSVGVV